MEKKKKLRTKVIITFSKLSHCKVYLTELFTRVRMIEVMCFFNDDSVCARGSVGGDQPRDREKKKTEVEEEFSREPHFLVRCSSRVSS